jgi:hypothetical protein|tara:strand:+ start:68 stop:274 length:207 start_codon:yes stop_codon:yes gene_type:complete
MTKSEIKKLQVKEANLWNDLKAWESYLGKNEERLQECKIYAMKLSEWSACDDILELLDIATDFELHKC